MRCTQEKGGVPSYYHDIQPCEFIILLWVQDCCNGGNLQRQTDVVSQDSSVDQEFKCVVLIQGILEDQAVGPPCYHLKT